MLAALAPAALAAPAHLFVPGHGLTDRTSGLNRTSEQLLDECEATGPWMRLTASSLQQAGAVEGDDANVRALARVQLVGVLILSVYAIFRPDEEPEDPALREALYDETADVIRRVLRGGN